MTALDYLIGYAPFAPMTIIALVLTYWLRVSRGVWVGFCLVIACVPGFFLALYLRKLGFDAYGGVCSEDSARGFMEAMQLVFLAQGVAGVAGSIHLGVLAMRKNATIGWVSLLVLAPVSILTAFMIYFAAGMTAVDGYRC